jgi:RNA polymerase sigma factor (sigma-70 family)
VTDEELIKLAADGDRDALAELFGRHQKPLFNFFLRGFGHCEEAEETMETFVRVFQNAARFRGHSFRAWLYHIAMNALRDRCRKRTRRSEIPASAVSGEWSAVPDLRPDRHPEPVALRSSLVAAVREAVQGLPERERAAVLLAEFEDFSHQEVGVALGMSTAAVKVLLFRTRRRLRKRLEGTAAGGVVELCL